MVVRKSDCLASVEVSEVVKLIIVTIVSLE